MGNALALKDRWVLVVDDNLDALEATAYLIEAVFGCNVLTASSTEHALALINERTRVDLLFADIVMPETDGVTLATLAKARLPGLPVVLVTGWHSEINSLIAKGDVALLKPYSVEQLQAVFSELIESSQQAIDN